MRYMENVTVQRLRVVRAEERGFCCGFQEEESMRWKVLIVEDDINFRYAIRELLSQRENDFEVVGAADYILKQDLDADILIGTLQNSCNNYLKEQRMELDRYQFQKELLDYIQGKVPSVYNENNPYSKLKTKMNMMLCLVKSEQGIRGQEEGDYEGNLVFCMKVEEEVWVFLYRLPKHNKKSEEMAYQMQILSQMRDRLHESAQIGGSDLIGEFKQLPVMYKMAETALRYFMYFPDKSIIHYLDIRRFEEGSIRNYLYQPPEHLLDVELGELEQVLEEYEKNLERYMPDEKAVNMGFINIYKEFQKGIRIEDADMEVLNYYEKIQNICMVKGKFDYTRELMQKMLPQYQESYKGTHQEIRRALKYIELHYAEELSLHDIAEYVGLSENYCSNLFKQEVGENMVFYINKVRIENAKKLLRNKSMKVYEVAEAVGYKNATYLSTMFKKIAGVSISEFKGRVGS